MTITTDPWQRQLAEAITDPKRLCDTLGLDIQQLSLSEVATQQFPLRVPLAYISRIEKRNPNDPLLRQVLPLGLELVAAPGFSKDPLNESMDSPVAGLLHKYHGRVLLTLTGTCAIHCRYCFRRHYPYADQVPGLSQWQPALDYIAGDATIVEVILSGGDPLAVKDASLAKFIEQLEQIPHVKRLRFHTRLPIVIPDRITDGLVAILAQTRFQTIVVFHINHPNELDDSVKVALSKLQSSTLLNQSVLLKGINDRAAVLIELSQRLFDHGVLPYYLHLLDPVAGAAHFEVSQQIAKRLIKEIGTKLPGYLVPKLVREVFKTGSKQSV